MSPLRLTLLAYALAATRDCRATARDLPDTVFSQDAAPLQGAEKGATE